MTVDLLKNKGHTVIEIELPNFEALLYDYLVAFFADGVQMMDDMCKGEEVLEAY